MAESAAKPGDGSYRLRSRLNQGRTILETIKIADDLIAEYEGDDIFLCFRVSRRRGGVIIEKSDCGSGPR